jgi:hypothetical protein
MQVGHRLYGYQWACCLYYVDVNANVRACVRPCEFQYMSSSFGVSIYEFVHKSVNTCVGSCECQYMHSYMWVSMHAFLHAIFNICILFPVWKLKIYIYIYIYIQCIYVKMQNTKRVCEREGEHVYSCLSLGEPITHYKLF